MEKFKVEQVDAGKRLDVFCFENMYEFEPNLTRSQIKNAVDKKLIKVNGTTEKAGYKIKFNDEIEVELVETMPQNLKKQNISLDIIFEDENFVVINKPQGMVVHPGNGNFENTLVNALLYKFSEIESNFNGEESSIRPGIVHRIDKNTSGLLVVAKTQMAFKSLSEQISKHECYREYVAICDGVFKESNGTLKTYIARHKVNKTKMAVCKESEGKLAITHYKVLKQFEKCALVQFNLETGRTHQIRVHASFINHPIVGDDVYGKATKGLNGQLLHARKLTFVSPTTNKLVEFSADLPDYFKAYLDKLK